MSRSPRTQKRSLLSRTLAGLTLATLAAACDSPTAPNRNAPAASQNRTEASQNGLDLTGAYTLTLSASSQCGPDLPQPMRTRKYAATIDQVGRSLTVKLPGILPQWGNAEFKGMLGENNDDVVFQVQFEEWFAEEPVTEFTAFGRMTATMSAGGLSGVLDGSLRGIVTNEGGRGNRVVTCSAPDHVMTLSR